MTSVDVAIANGVTGSRVDDENKEDRPRTYVPDKCAICQVELYIGLSCFIFACHKHAICAKHGIDEAQNQHECQFCIYEEELAKEKESCMPFEDKNSLDPFPMCDPTGVVPAPKSQLYGFPALYQTPSVKSLTFDRSIEIDFASRTCWQAGDNDSIIVGGWNKLGQPTLSVVSANGQLITRVLSCGKRVISGLLVRLWVHVVGMTYDLMRNTSSNKFHLVILDPTSSDLSPIHPLTTLDIHNPAHVFKKSVQLYGVLCMDGSRPPYSHGRIRLFDVDQLVLPRHTDIRTFRSTSHWGRRTLIHLDLPDPHPGDTVAVAPPGLYCIASYMRHEIRIHSSTGMYLYTLGEGRPWDGRLYSGKLLYPRSIQCTRDSKVVVTGWNGDVQMYNMISKAGTFMWKKYAWVKGGDANKDGGEYDTRDKRKVYYLKDDEDGWSIVRNEYKDVYYSTVTRTYAWDIDKNEPNRSFSMSLYSVH